MGSIVKTTRVAKATGKQVTQFRAYVRREGFASRSKVCKTEREAREWLRNNESDSALRKKTTKDTLADLIEQFVDSPPMKGTRYWEPSHLDYWKDELGELKVSEITKGAINRARAKLQNKPAMRSTTRGPIPTDKKLSNGTVNRYLTSLASVFNYAIKHDIIEEHPMKGGKVEHLEESNGRSRILTADEEARLLTAAKASVWPMLHLFVRMCLTTAARRGEILNLRWRDVSLEDSVAILGKTKNGRARALPLVSDVKVALAEAKKVRPLRGDFVFYDPRNPEKTKAIDTAWRACRKAAGLLNDREDPLDRVVLHTTRHTGVTKMLRGGANLAQAASVSGHQTLAMLKRYEHLAAQDSVELAERLLGGNPGA
jgi:integrase